MKSLVSVPLNAIVLLTYCLKYLTTHKALSDGNAPNTISFWWLLGVEVLRGSPNLQRTSFFVQDMFLKSISQMAWPRCPDTNIHTRTTLIVNCWSDRLFAGDHFFKNLSTTSASHVIPVQGKVGHLLNTPLKKILTRGWFPTEQSPFKDSVATALYAMFKALYTLPSLWSLVRKIIRSFAEGPKPKGIFRPFKAMLHPSFDKMNRKSQNIQNFTGLGDCLLTLHESVTLQQGVVNIYENGEA